MCTLAAVIGASSGHSATLLIGDELAFVVGNKTSFELPLQHVANSNIAGRTEVSLEFMTPSDSAGKKPSKGQPDEMVEIRFFVPGQSMRTRGSDAGSNKSEAEDDGDDVSAAQAFHDAIKDKAELGHVSGDIILSFEEVLVLTPRGRYDVDMFPDFLRLRGKTYDYKIVYTSISRLFLLPKDDLHILFIVRSVNAYIEFPYSHLLPSLASISQSDRVRPVTSIWLCNLVVRRRSLLN